MTKIGTLKELDVKPGDVVELVECPYYYPPEGTLFTIVDRGNRWVAERESGRYVPLECGWNFRIVSRASEAQPDIDLSNPDRKTWRKMTDAEKGAMLLAKHEGKVIEFSFSGITHWKRINDPSFNRGAAYRVKPELVRETVALMNDKNCGWSFYEDSGTYKNTHRITFDLVDGEPDVTSIKMEKLS
jgi:hypothetical protein